MFFRNIELHIKYKKHDALRKKEATEVIEFGFSKAEEEKFILSKKSFTDFKDTIDRKENVI